MNPIPEVKPFNLAEASRRNADFLVTYLTIAMGGVRPDEEQSHEISKKLIEHLTDSAQALDEIKRLYAVLENLQRRHMPARWHSGRGGVVRGLLVARGAGSVAVRDVHAGGQGAAGEAAVR